LKKLAAILLIILLSCCCTNNPSIDAEYSILKQLNNGTVYKILIKTNEYYYPHYLFLPDNTENRTLLPVLYICGTGTPDAIFFDIGFASTLDKIINENKLPLFALVGDDHDKVKTLLEYYNQTQKFDLFIDVGQSDPLFEAHALPYSKN